MSWDTRQYDLTLHPTPQLTRPNSLPTMCFKIYMMASSSPQNTDAIPPKILHAVDLFPPFGVCEDSKMGLFTTFCQIPSKSSLWCCPKETQVWMPVTGSVSVEGTSFWFLSGCKYKDFSSALCANTSAHLCTNTQAHVPKGKQTHISQHQFQPVPIIFQPFISCLVAFSTSALNCSSNTFWFHF